VDKFKSFNDEFGHPQGDQALINVARTVEATLRDSDFFARYGGEEFAVLLPHMEAEGSFLAAERIRNAVEQADWPKRAVTVSIGVAALSPSADMDRKVLLARADRALYQAKAGGRNRSQRFEDWPAAMG
jgi:diguanylate cyclase (GGDEF)-like protein